MAEVFDLGIDWDDKNSLSQIIANLEKVLAAQKKMIENNAKLSSSYDEHLSKIKKQFTEINKEIKKTNSEIKNATSAAGIEQSIQKNDKLRSTYKMLKDEVVRLEKERVKAMKTNAQVNEQKIREQQMAAREKKAIRERIKDEQALNTVRNRTIKSQKDLREVTNALVRLRDRLDTTTAKGRKKWDEYSRAIANNTQKLKDNDAQIGRFQRNVGNYQSALSGAVNTAKRFAIGLAGGVGVFTVIRSGLNVVKDFDQAMQNLKAISGATADEFELLKNQARDLGASTQYTASEVAGLQTELAKLGFSTTEINQSTEAILDFATATGAELPEAASLAGSALRAFNLDASEMDRVVSTLGVATTKTALDFQQLNAGLSTVAPVAASFGFSIEDTTALLGQLANAGFDASSSATATRNILLNLADANGKLAKELGRPIKNADDLAQGLQELQAKGIDLATALELTDKRSVAAFSTFMQGSDSLVSLRDSITDANDELQNMADIQRDSLQGAFDRLNSAWEGLILDTSEAAGGLFSLKDAIDFVADNLEDIVKIIITAGQAWVSYKTATIAARVATSAYSLVTKGAAIATALFSGNTTRAAAGMRLLNTTMAMNPIGLVVAGLTTLATAMSLFGDSTEDASDEVNKLSESEQKLQDIQNETEKKLHNEIGAMEALFMQLKQTNSGSDERLILINKINKTYGTTLQNLEDETEFAKQLAIAYNQVISSIKQKIAIQSQEETLTALYAEQSKAIKTITDRQDDLLKFAKVGQVQFKGVSGAIKEGVEGFQILAEAAGSEFSGTFKTEADLLNVYLKILQKNTKEYGTTKENAFEVKVLETFEKSVRRLGGRSGAIGQAKQQILDLSRQGKAAFEETQAVINAFGTGFDPSITGEGGDGGDGGDGGSTNAARERALTFLDQLEERLKRNLEEREKLVDLQTPENDPYLLALKSEATELTNQISKVKELIELKKESADVDETKIKLLEAEIKKFEQLNTAGEVVEYRQDGSGSTRRTGRIDRLKIEREFELETIQIKLDAIEKERKAILGRYADAGELSAEDLEAFKNTESQKVQLINKRKELEFDAEIEDIQKRKYDAEIEFYQGLVDGKKKSDEEILQAEKEFNEEMISLKLEEIDAELRLYDVESLEYKKLLAEKLKLEKEFTDSKNEEEENRRQAIKDTQQLVKKGFEDGLRLAQQYANEDKQLAEDALNQQKSNVDLQKELAKQGLENTLAFEQQLQKEKEKAILEEAKRLERIKRIETYYNLFAAYANDPETSPAEAAGKALIQLGIGQAIAAKLEDGGVIADAVAQQNGGILRGASHRNGGILIEAEGNEGIFSKKEMSNIGRDRFYALKNVFGDRRLTDDYFNKANHELLHVSMPVVNDNKALESKLDIINNQLAELPNKMPRSQQWIDKHGNLVTREEFNNSVKQTTQKRRFNR